MRFKTLQLVFTNTSLNAKISYVSNVDLDKF